MRKLYTLMILIPLLFSCDKVKDSFGTSYIEGDKYAKITVKQHGLTADEEELSRYSATIESIGQFDFTSGEKFCLVSNGQDNVTIKPQVHVYNKLTDNLSFSDNFLGDDVVVSSDYKYGVADNDGKNIYYGVSSFDLSQDKDIYECQVDVCKVIKDQPFNIKLYGGDVSNVESLYATLSGIAQRWNLTKNDIEGSGSTIELPISAEYDSDNYSNVRLFGIDTLRVQIATVKLKFKDSKLDDQIETFVINNKMSDFNKDKSKEAEMITLEIEIPKAPEDLDSDGTINGWEGEEEGDNYEAEKN